MSSNNFADLFNKGAPCGRKDTFYATVDNKSRVFIRTESRFFDITGCKQVLADGHIDDNDGLIPDAIQVSAQEVADLVAESRARAEQLQRVESLVREWIELRQSRSRKAKRRLQLQKKEVSN